MKKLLFLLVVFISVQVHAQKEEVFSFYFHQDAMAQLKSVRAVSTALYGRFELADEPQNEVRRAAGEYLIVDETGIYLEKNRLLSISREEVRENSSYRVSKGWLHGVVENDSVPCALDGENYFFLVPAKTYLFGNGTGPERLVQITSQKYAVFTIAENGHFSSIIIEFNKAGVSMNDIVFSMKDPNNIQNIEKKEVKEDANGITTYILTPTIEEWESFIFKSCYETYDSYSVVANE